MEIFENNNYAQQKLIYLLLRLLLLWLSCRTLLIGVYSIFLSRQLLRTHILLIFNDRFFSLTLFGQIRAYICIKRYYLISNNTNWNHIKNFNFQNFQNGKLNTYGAISSDGVPQFPRPAPSRLNSLLIIHRELVIKLINLKS